MIRVEHAHLGDDPENQGRFAAVLARLRDGDKGVNAPKPHQKRQTPKANGTATHTCQQTPYGHMTEVRVKPNRSAYWAKLKHSEGEEEYLGDAIYLTPPEQDPQLITAQQQAGHYIREMLKGSGLSRAGIQVGQRLLRGENYADTEGALLDPQVSFYADPQKLAECGERMATVLSRVFGHEIRFVEEKFGKAPVYKLEGVSLQNLAELSWVQIHSGNHFARQLSGAAPAWQKKSR